MEGTVGFRKPHLTFPYSLHLRAPGNVKTVKEQTFHKRSINVPISTIGMNKKLLSSFPNLYYRKRSFLLGLEEQILDQIETICFQLEKFGNDTKTF
jgi:hypothetical protein